MVQHQIPVGIHDEAYIWGGEITQKYLGHAKYSLAGIIKKSQKLKHMQAWQNGW